MKRSSFLLLWAILLAPVMSQANVLTKEKNNRQQVAAVDTMILKDVVLNVNVPAGTKQCHVVGNFNNWDVVNSPKMLRIDSVNYQVTIKVADVNALNYKYVCGPNWAYVEKGATGEEVPNRSYAQYDKVAKWLNIFDPGLQPLPKTVTIEVSVPAKIRQMYLTGTFSQWVLNDSSMMMLKEDDGTWKTFTKKVNSSDVNMLAYKFIAGPVWDYVQTHDVDWHFPNPATSDYVHHRLFGFWKYYQDSARVQDWNMSKMPFGNMTPDFRVESVVNGLRIKAGQVNNVFVRASAKKFEQVNFTHELVLMPLVQTDPAKDNYERYLEFRVAGPCQIAVSTLSNDKDFAADLNLHNGDSIIHKFVAPAPWQDEVLLEAYNYTGGPRTFYLFTNNPKGVGIYYLGVNNLTDPEIIQPQVRTFNVEVPAGTQQVFIAGDFNNWTPGATAMMRIDSTHFSITMPNIPDSVQYKYLCGPNWKHVEVDALGNEIPNRRWAPNDKVLRWAAPFIPGNTRIFAPAVNASLNSYFEVVLKSESTDPRQVIAYQFTYNYNQDVMQYDSYDIVGTLSSMGKVVVNASQWGKLFVSFMHENPIPVNGDLIRLKFKAVKTGISTSYISDFFYNADIIHQVNDIGVINIQNMMLGDVDGNSMVQAYDAALTLQYSVGKDPMPWMDPLPWEGWRMAAANVDLTGEITANDAAMILQYSAHMIASFNQPKDSGMNKAPAATTADVRIELSGNDLVFKSYGDVIGFNLFAVQQKEALGNVVFPKDVSMTAVNTDNGNYAVGIAMVQPLSDGQELMRISLKDTQATEVLFNFVVNTRQTEVLAKLPTGLRDATGNALRVYPNPASESVFIQDIAAGAVIQLMDISGKLLMEKTAVEDMESLDVSSLNAGVYLINVTDKNRVMHNRFVKR